MASALETLCGQAFGAGEIEMMGVYMQRSWIILFVTCFFILPLYIFATPVLKLLGQRHDIAELAGTFSLQVIPQMFSLAFNFPTQKFLQAQSKVSILAWIGLVAFIIHIGILYFFISVFGWGTAGAAWAYNFSAWLITIAQVIYVVNWCKDGWKGLSWLAFKDIWGFVRLSIASAVALCLEIWYFMTIIVLTGHLADPVIAVGSLSICMNINGWEGMLFIGINAAISVRVSNELGSRHPRAAKYSVIVTVIESLFIGILAGIIILATRNHFSVIFTSSKEMQKAVAHLASLLGITMVLNSVQPVISGVAVGGGWQALVAYINLFCYYVVGLPLGFLLGYKTSLGVEGIWIGMICGTCLQTVILICIVYKTNWNYEVEQASERMRKWGAGRSDRIPRDYSPANNFKDVKYIFFVESTKLWSIACPIAFNILCFYGIISFTNIFAGHIGDIELSAVAISLSVIANFSYGFMHGMGSALETLCGQAFGAGKLELMGVYMQRSWIILFVTCFFLLPFYFFATPLLKILGQQHDIADLAGKFSIQIIPQLFSLAICIPTQKFLQAQSKVSVLAWIGFVGLIIHIGLLYFFINFFGWGTAGAALAFNVSGWLIVVAQLIYVVGWCKDGWRGLSWLAFKDICGFVRLSIASAVMLCLEVCMNINGWETMLFLGINVAISIRVSNELGSGHPRAAKYSVIVTVIESLFIGILAGILIMATRNHLSIIFTSSKEMQKAVAHLASLLGITMVLNSIQPVLSGVALGGGWQGTVAYINLFCYYIVGLPFGFLLGYRTSLGVEGIWIGMVCGTLLQTLILLLIVYKTNWNKEVEQASQRIKKWGAVHDIPSEIEI
ncbi:hypothetical protein Dsin_026078 [Dipteronia sinensis]|uniref:Protein DETOXIFICATION n=1 Tax=Dipteronia sinensis TaxID=43782 RepID=A0AAD9ZYG7_9ROSI|nr:hypothetical protein Dsin_026078 [Dipteronia sinensis]